MSQPKTQIAQKKPFSMAINSEGYRKTINNTLGDPERSRKFIASITTAVASNAALQECEASTILAGALLGESLNLSPSSQLGQYYLVPFNQKEKRDRNGNLIQPACTNAQFILGYKGYVQLALRSGYYRSLNVMEVRDGEYAGRDPMTGDPRFSFIEDDDLREETPVIGYMACFEYLNGFRKAIYWSKEKMLKHADQYSAAFNADRYRELQNGQISERDMWKYSSFWYKDFDGMAKKTMLRQIISKWGVMSTELQSAVQNDNKALTIDHGEIVTAGEPALEPELPQPIDAPPAEPQPAEPETVNIDDL